MHKSWPGIRSRHGPGTLSVGRMGAAVRGCSVSTGFCVPVGLSASMVPSAFHLQLLAAILMPLDVVSQYYGHNNPNKELFFWFFLNVCGWFILGLERMELNGFYNGSQSGQNFSSLCFLETLSENMCWTLSTATELWIHELGILKVGYIHRIQNYAWNAVLTYPQLHWCKLLCIRGTHSRLEAFLYMQPKKRWERHVVLPFLIAVFRTVWLLTSAYSPWFFVCAAEFLPSVPWVLLCL